MKKSISSIKDIFSGYPEREYKKGQILFHKGDELSRVSYVMGGLVKVYNISDDGDERILLLLGPGMLVPFSLSFGKAYRIRYFYEAFTDCKVKVVPRERIGSAVKSSTDVKLLMAQRLEDLLIDLSDRLTVFENKNSRDKIAKLLPYLVKTGGKKLSKNTYALNFKITHQEIANMTGLARETASIQMKGLEKDGVLSYRDTSTVINLSKIPD